MTRQIMTKDTDYLIDDMRPASTLTREERGVLGLVRGLSIYTAQCAEKYGDACAAIEMGLPQMFRGARSMLNYAPDSLRRGALDSDLAAMLRAWKVNPDTLEWEGE